MYSYNYPNEENCSVNGGGGQVMRLNRSLMRSPNRNYITLRPAFPGCTKTIQRPTPTNSSPPLTSHHGRPSPRSRIYIPLRLGSCAYSPSTHVSHTHTHLRLKTSSRHSQRTLSPKSSTLSKTKLSRPNVSTKRRFPLTRQSDGRPWFPSWSNSRPRPVNLVFGTFSLARRIILTSALI